MNVVILTGRLTAEPELRYTQQNVPCTSFNLAVDRASKGDDADFPRLSHGGKRLNLPVSIFTRAAALSSGEKSEHGHIPEPTAKITR